jgi:hypothetical protein
VDDGVREGLILEVPHADGSPPYVVRWLDDERSTFVFPSSDATVRSHSPHSAAPAGA